MQQFTYVITDPLGIHARPAGMIVKKASEFSCEITLKTSSAQADAKRVMAVMGLVAKQNTPVTVICDGEDEQIAAKELGAFFREHL